VTTTIVTICALDLEEDLPGRRTIQNSGLHRFFRNTAQGGAKDDHGERSLIQIRTAMKA
jgi:hypothetical protein